MITPFLMSALVFCSALAAPDAPAPAEDGAPSPSAASNQDPTAGGRQPVDPEEVVAAALAHDPELAQAEAAVIRAEGQLTAAQGLRHDPTLSARLGFGLTQHELALSQPLSLSGEGLAAAAAARAGVEAAQAEAHRRRIEVAAHARNALIGAIAAEREYERAGHAHTLARELREAAEKRLAAGDAATLEVHLARLEEAAAAADRIHAGKATIMARELLARRCGLAHTVPLPKDPMAAIPWSQPHEGGVAGQRTDLTAARARAAEATAELRRAKAATFSPVELGVWAQLQAPTPNAPADLWSVGPSLTWTLPVWARNPDDVAVALAGRQEATSQLRATEAAVTAEQAAGTDRRALIHLAEQTPDPGAAAEAALAGVAAAVGAGQLGRSEAALLRARILDAWRAGAAARTEAAYIAIDLALAEAWPSLIPATGTPSPAP